MVDSRKALESEYVTVDAVKNSKTKKLVIVHSGAYESTDWGERLTLRVNIDNKIKLWRPNRDSIKNMQEYGNMTEDWVNTVVDLSIVTMKGKEMVIGVPSRDNANDSLDR